MQILKNAVLVKMTQIGLILHLQECIKEFKYCTGYGYEPLELHFQFYFLFFKFISLEIDPMDENILSEFFIKPHLTFNFKMVGICCSLKNLNLRKFIWINLGEKWYVQSLSKFQPNSMINFFRHFIFKWRHCKNFAKCQIKSLFTNQFGCNYIHLYIANCKTSNRFIHQPYPPFCFKMLVFEQKMLCMKIILCLQGNTK